MGTLERLDRRIKERIAAGEEARERRRDRMREVMDDTEERLRRYTEVADRLTQEVIRPRLERLAACFDNARAPEDRNSRHTSVYEFERTLRYPATATLELAVTRDGDAAKVRIEYNLKILPVFFVYTGEDRLVMGLDEVDMDKAAAWVEDKLLEFVDAYVQLESADQYQAENTVADPVCGMRVNRADAPASMEYRGAKYYFCVEECRRRFAEDPEKYAAASGKGSP
jgi:YHS domain-containing protein